MKKGCQEEAVPRLERKTVERNRRLQMKSLCFKLSSLIPREELSGSPKQDSPTQHDDLDQAAVYIRQLQERVDGLKQRKEAHLTSSGVLRAPAPSSPGEPGPALPVIELRDLGSSLEVVLVCDAAGAGSALFYDAIGVLEEEGAEVVNASFSAVGDKIFHTIHSQVSSPGTGLEASRVAERIKELVS